MCLYHQFSLVSLNWKDFNLNQGLLVKLVFYLSKVLVSRQNITLKDFNLLNGGKKSVCVCVRDR